VLEYITNWETKMTPELILTGLLLIGTLGLYTLGKRLKQVDVALSTFMLFFLYLALVWLPLDWRNGLMALIIVLIGSAAGSFVGGAIFAAATYWVSGWIPGGMSALLLLVVALFVLLFIHDSIEHLKRINRAKRLEPGKATGGEVGLGGKIEATRPIPSPLPDVSCAAWWFTVGEATRNSGAAITLKRDDATALIELNNIKLGLAQNTRTIAAEELRKFIETNSISIAEPKPDDTGKLQWIEEGREAYLIGIPTWEARQEGASQYRESNLTAVFRSTPEQQCYLADHSKDHVHQGAIWDLAVGIGSFVNCALIVGFQLFVIE
jgi:energy-coupling factor transporter transmembrane protein EcfT